ncbi:hypothetical protein HGRIS_012547 [Hohenbuehelia grisea]|uniref:DUF6533 domain-containing protein n=1 Tax=Hohenbuehelia grisea TaxID=104357 RepID=A0ABR3ISP9_9AGAR
MRTHSSLIALTLLAFEYITTLDREVAVIWRRAQPKYRNIYLFSRYFGLIAQSVNAILTINFDSNYRLWRLGCVAWHSYQTSVFQILLILVENIQANQVCALYQLSNLVRVPLNTYRGLTLIFSTYAMVATIRSLQYDRACLVSDVPVHTVWFGISAILSQVIFSTLMLFAKLLRDHKVWETPFVRTLVRDAGVTLVCTVAMFILIILHSELLAHVIPPFCITLLSICSCRMIMNLQEAPKEHSAASSRGLALTTFIEEFSIFALEEDQDYADHGDQDLALDFDEATNSTRTVELQPDILATFVIHFPYPSSLDL